MTRTRSTHLGGSRASATAPTIPQLALLGALVGALSGLWLVALQDVSAAAAKVLWTVYTPWLNFPLYALVGGLGGALVAPLLELVRRLVAHRTDAWIWAASWLGLGAYAARTLGYPARLLLAHHEWPRVRAVLLPFLVLLCLTALVRVVLRRRPPSGLRQALVASLWVMLPTLTASFLTHVLLVGDLMRRRTLMIQGWRSVIVVAVVGLTATLVGLALRGWRPAAVGRPTAGRVAAGVVLAGVLAVGIYAQWERTPPPPGPPPRGPNVLVMVLDTLRRDAVSAYGVVAGTTPVLESFAAQGVLWEDAMVPGNWTIPSHASLFTGAQVSRHGTDNLRFVLRERPGGPDSQPLPTMAEVFRQRGWRTVAFTCNGQLNPDFGFDRGFSEYYEVWRGKKGDYDALARAIRRWLPIGVFDRGGDRAVRGLSAWISAHGSAGRPWLAFINMTEPHSPYDTPEPWLNRYMPPGEAMGRREANDFGRITTEEHKFGGLSPAAAQKLWHLYLGAVSYQDHLVGRLLETLERADLAQDTVVVIVSDHGENFGWSGQTLHGVALNEDLLRIPMMARGPGIPAGVREPSPVSLVDVLPTLLYLTGGQPLPPDAGRTGRVLPPMGGKEEADRVRIAERYADYLVDPAEFSRRQPEADLRWAVEESALIDGPWKAIDWEGPYPDILSERVSASAPPADDGSREVADGERLQSMLARLRALRATWTRAVEPAAGAQPELDEETREHLRALGYIN